MHFNLFLFALMLSIMGTAQDSNPLNKILDKGNESFKNTLRNKGYEIQIIYGEIDAPAKEIRHHYFQYAPDKYFYPASAVKMPVVFAAMQKMNKEKIELTDSVFISSSLHNQRVMSYDSLFTSAVTFQNLIKKIFVYSDNQAYNILYGFLGKDYINDLHVSIGLPSTKIVHQLSEDAFGHSPESNHYTYSLSVPGKKKVKYKQEATYNMFPSKSELSGLKKGKGYIDGNGKLVSQPFDFTHKNAMALEDLLSALERVVMPHAFYKNERYLLTGDDYDFLNRVMLMKPRELPPPMDKLPDNYAKFFLYGDKEQQTIPDKIQIKNKIGEAYGFLTDVAYIKDKQRNIEFFLAATIHVNNNGIYNDGVYEYEEVGIPFLAQVGRLVYQYELNKH